MIRRHWGLAVLLAAGAALRIAALMAIAPGTWFSDSNVYVEAAATGNLSVIRPVGYSLFVAPFYALGSAQALIVFQHGLGLAIAAGIYTLLIRRGVPRRLAFLGAAPAALDLYLVVVEHTMMAEAVFHAAILGAVALVLLPAEPGRKALIGAGLLLGYVAVVRSVGVPLLAVFAAYLLIRRAGWRGVALLVAGWALVAGGYATAFAVQHGRFAFSASSGMFLYGKVAPFADCATLESLPAAERAYCPDPAHRLTPNEYVWDRDSPIFGVGPEDQASVRAFAVRVIKDRPGRYADLVVDGVLHYFRGGHEIGPDDYPVEPWQFPEDPETIDYPFFRGAIRPGIEQRQQRHPITEPNRYVDRMVDTPRVDPVWSRRLHDLQGHLYTSGPVFAVCVLLVALALLLRRGPGRLRADAAMLTAAALVCLVIAQALSVFSYRYGFTLIVLLPPAAALALTSLLADRTRPLNR